MVDAIECTLLKEGVEVKEYICKLSRKLQEGVDNSRLAQETQTEGANVMSAACLVCQRVFTLTKAGLVQTHGPVDCCSGSRAPPASNSSASPSLGKVQQGPTSPVQGEEEDLQRLPNICRENPERIPCGLREVEVRKLASVVEAAVTKNDQASWNRFLHFATCCLHARKRGGSRRNLVREMNDQIRAESDPPLVPSHLQPT